MGKGGRGRFSASLSITQEICGRAPRQAPITAGAALPADEGKRKSSPEENNETWISTHSQITTLNKCGAPQLLLPTVSPMARSWLDIKYQRPGRLGWAASSSCLCVPALHLELVVLMPNHRTTACPWWLIDPYTDIHCSWTRDREMSRSPILV